MGRPKKWPIDVPRSDSAAYMRAYRRVNVAAAERNRRQVDAYCRAEAELRERHREEFEALYRKHLGLPEPAQFDGTPGGTDGR